MLAKMKPVRLVLGIHGTGISGRKILKSSNNGSYYRSFKTAKLNGGSAQRMNISDLIKDFYSKPDNYLEYSGKMFN